MDQNSSSAQNRLIAYWLLIVSAMVFLMVMVGGATRLTESGLSIVQWKPISGILPPMTQDSWQTAFEEYKKIPEYQKINKGMSLQEFKGIYWWEYSHRLLGRAIGLVFALPFAWFLLRRRIPKGYGPRFTLLLALGGLQGLIGWWMVASGLSVRTDVSHYRLAIHLLMALVIFSFLLWSALDLLELKKHPAVQSLRAPALLVLALLPLQILYGAFVAGLNAGFAFNTWPLMGEHFVPSGMWDASLSWLNLSENPITVQFIHRLLAYALTIAVFWAVWRGWRSRARGLQRRSLLLGLALLLQVSLGIATLVKGVPIPLGVAHQGGAVLLLASALIYAHRGWRGKA